MCVRWGGDKHARFRLQSGARSALGVAFGVDGKLAESRIAEPLHVSLRLELNEWQGAVSPRVVLGELYSDAPQPSSVSTVLPERRRVDREVQAEREAVLDQWPPPELVAGGEGAERREVIDRRGASGVAAVAAVASSGAAVLAVCADALRRRDLVERAAAPIRFGGGEVAIASGRLADGANRDALASVADAGSGVVLADWAALARDRPRRDGSSTWS